MSPRFAVGIDLGTTHSALSYIDLARPPAPATQPLLPVPQTVALGEVDGRALLPSCLYLPLAGELPSGSLALPWDRTPSVLVGTFARDLGATTPLRLVDSAKSWLAHTGVDRRAPLLPTDAPDDVAKLSPVDASARYLAHLRAAWDHAHPEAPLAQQHVTLTVPASFDPAARELTLDAARAAGLPTVTLLEEPQAALYGWLERRPDWRDELALGEVLLVVDVGGGTTDFSLIAVLEHEGELALQRVAVGDHILLGGDNMDLTLAYGVKTKLEATGATLDAWQLRALTHACRVAKEQLLSDESPLAAVPVVLPSRGAKLVGASLRTELTRDEALVALVDGFLPQVNSGDAPAARTRSALAQLGLPYAQDAAITRHLAAFLTRQAGAGAELPMYRHPGASFLHPTAVLLNGGVLKAGPLARRVMDTLNAWITSEGGEPARVLGGADLDHAVARGAAYHAHAKHADSSRVRIRGGLAQSLYVGVEVATMAVPGMAPELHALCIAPHGLQEGELPEAPPQQLGLVVGEPVRFRCFASSTRHDDSVGSVLTHVAEPELMELGAIELTLPAAGHRPGDVVAVQLQARLTELGALELLAQPVGQGEPFVVSWQVRDL